MRSEKNTILTQCDDCSEMKGNGVFIRAEIQPNLKFPANPGFSSRLPFKSHE